ncbi:MAG: alpha/beta hydrolase [Caulobacterales bacterium]|nr:alpha/beta hydrolase [Caulobacterales bacterium]
MNEMSAVVAEEAIAEEPVTLRARDGYELAGLWIAPREPSAAVLIQAGTGFPKEFYRRFARFGAERGAACLLFDYRGVAASAPAALGEMEMDYTDWGRLDTPAAIDALTARYPDLPATHIGHSVGGHFLGFAPNQDRLVRHAFICVGSGYWGRHALAFRPAELFFWWAYGPVSLALTGHIAPSVLWSGAALPRGVFTTWRRWCAKPDYFRGELAGRLQPHQFEAVAAPIRSFIYSDDPIANRRTAGDMLEVYPNAPSQIAYRRPADYGLKAIGHSGLFRRSAAPAWGEVWDWALHARAEA